jgi:uncharacterized membrane protein
VLGTEREQGWIMTETRHDLGVHGAQDVHRMLDRWAHAGLIDEAQVEQIETFEVAHHPVDARRRGGLLVEAMAYLGGALALAASLLLVQLVWTDLSTAGRLAVPAVATVALLGGGALVPGHPADRRRLRSAMWLLATGAWAATLAVLGHQVLEWSGVDTALLIGLGSSALALALYIRFTEVLQHLALLASVATTGAAVGARADWDEPSLIGAGVWVVAAAWAVAGELGYLPPQPAARYGSAVAMVTAALLMNMSVGGQLAAAVTLGWLFGLGLKRDSVGLLAIAAYATLQLVPLSVQYFFPGNARIMVPATLLTVGCTLLVLAVVVSRRRGRRGQGRPPGEALSRG